VRSHRLAFGYSPTRTVLNNCQQYLCHFSSLSKTLESLAIEGNDRPVTIVLSTSDPNTLSSSVLHSLDYVIFGSSRSLPWGEFLHKHFTKQAKPKAQSRVGRAMIWSPASSIHEASNEDFKTRKAWDELLSFIDIEQFEQSMPSTPVPNNPSNVTLIGGGRPNGTREEKKEIGSESTTQETTSKNVNQADDDEEGIISLDELGFMEPFTVTTEGPTSSLGSSGAVNEKVKVCAFSNCQTRTDTIPRLHQMSLPANRMNRRSPIQPRIPTPHRSSFH
jgi:hypothetical protein